MKHLLIFLLVFSSTIFARDNRDQPLEGYVNIGVKTVEDYNAIMNANPNYTEDRGTLGCKIGRAVIGSVKYGSYDKQGNWQSERTDNRIFKELFWKEGSNKLPYFIKRRAERQFKKSVERFKTLDLFWESLTYLASFTTAQEIIKVLNRFGILADIKNKATIRKRLLKESVDNILYLEATLKEYRTDCVLYYALANAKKYGVLQNIVEESDEDRITGQVKMIMKNLKQLSTYEKKYRFLSERLKDVISIF